MAKRNTIKEYLVALGWDIDQTSLRKFKDALKSSGVEAEKFAKNMTLGFTTAGAAVVAAFGAIGAGTIGLMASVAKQDLEFQIFARRMYMGADAARKMKMATDALGYSIEEIIWGPPELAQRYQQLIQDQTKMFALLGGDQGEKALQKIRDIGFQFTRMEPALRIFGIRLTEDIMNKIFGGSESLEQRLKAFVDWFESPAGFVRISKEFSDVLGPAILGVGKAFEWVWNQLKSASGLVQGPQSRGEWQGFLRSDPNRFAPAQSIGALKAAGSPLLRGLLGGPTATDEEKTQFWKQLWSTVVGRDEVIGKAMAVGKPYGSDATAEFLALLEQESNFDPSARNARTGATGLGQVMPQNWPTGKNPASVDDQLAVAAAIFFGNLRKRKGNVKDALHDYYGWGTPGPGEPSFDQYFQQWQDKYNQWKNDPVVSGTYQPMSYNVDVGGIHIMNPGASKEEIQEAVKKGVDDAMRLRAQRNFALRQGAYA